MGSYATLRFDCPECDSPNQFELNIGCARLEGENSGHCGKCGVHIEIGIDVMADEQEEK